MTYYGTSRRQTDSREKILAAAEKLFTVNGYVETTTAAIAREAGVNETTLFRNFGNKASLFRELFNPAPSFHIDPELKDSLSGGEDMKGDLRLLFRYYLGFSVKHIPNYRLSVQQIDEAFDSEFYQSSVERINSLSGWLVSYLIRLRKQGKIIEVDCEAISEFIFSLFLIKAPQYLMQANSMKETERALDDAAEEYAEFVYRLIKKRDKTL